MPQAGGPRRGRGDGPHRGSTIRLVTFNLGLAIGFFLGSLVSSYILVTLYLMAITPGE